MEIKTKLSVNQNCWFVADQQLGNAPVINIIITVEKELTTIIYKMVYNNYYYNINEQHAFPTKQELIESL